MWMTLLKEKGLVMIRTVTFKNTESSEVLEKYANQQLQKIVDFLEHEKTPIRIDMVFEPSKVREHHNVELRVSSPNYHAISRYEYQGVSFYDTVDRVIDTMYRELHEQKRRHIDERKVLSRADKFEKKG